MLRFGSVSCFQLFGLPFWRRLPAWTRLIPIVILAAIIVGMYSWIPDEQGRPWRRMYEVIFIPSILLLLPVLLFAIIYVFLRIDACFATKEHPKWLHIVFTILAMSMLMCCVGVGVLIQTLDASIPMSVVQFIVYPTFALFMCIQMMLMKKAFPFRNAVAPEVEMHRNLKSSWELTVLSNSFHLNWTNDWQRVLQILIGNRFPKSWAPERHGFLLVSGFQTVGRVPRLGHRAIFYGTPECAKIISKKLFSVMNFHKWLRASGILPKNKLKKNSQHLFIHYFM